MVNKVFNSIFYTELGYFQSITSKYPMKKGNGGTLNLRNALQLNLLCLKTELSMTPPFYYGMLFN